MGERPSSVVGTEAPSKTLKGRRRKEPLLKGYPTGRSPEAWAPEGGRVYAPQRGVVVGFEEK